MKTLFLVSLLALSATSAFAGAWGQACVRAQSESDSRARGEANREALNNCCSQAGWVGRCDMTYIENNFIRQSSEWCTTISCEKKLW